MANEVKQVKVDNWGIYFLQRLKHFFNRTDYCDLTLQFQDNAQLKVHRLVLSACTEYFELLERTCEMYEDCLVMPDDLQADIVVPIVNFMYTGQLEFRMELLERLYQCSEIMNMPVLSKLLDSHRPKTRITQSYSNFKRTPKRVDGVAETIKSISATEIVTTTTPVTYKRSHNKAFEKTTVYRDKKIYLPINKPTLIDNGGRPYREPSPIPLDQRFNKKVVLGDPRPTRYELPEELDTENIFENSFCNISYTSQPLMVHPETRKQYAKRSRLSDGCGSNKMGLSLVDIVECKKSNKASEDSLFHDSVLDDTEMFSEQLVNVKPESTRDPNQLFDQMLERNEEPSKVTIETKNKPSGNIDHAKIISEVLKKYPHLVKSNKNIKLKILNTPYKNIKKKASPVPNYNKAVKAEKEIDYTFETDVLDSKQAARLIALGADNIDGPWICLICGAPGKAMNFTSYYKFRRHLVEVHNEKPVLSICEYCGQKTTKRNYLLHHLYTKHGVEPPPQYHFPKCNHCNYIALTEALLIKHKSSTHTETKNFRCNVCPSSYSSSSQLLTHIRNTGHKYSAERKTNLQCIYCQRVFLRESNLCAHLKSHHKKNAIKDGIIDDSDEEEQKQNVVKTEPSNNDFEELDIQYQIQQRPDGNITLITKKVHEPATSTKQKILNTGLSTQDQSQSNEAPKTRNSQNEYTQEINITSSNNTQEEIVLIDNIEYTLRNNHFIPRKPKQISEEYILSDNNIQAAPPTTSMEINMHNTNVQDNIQHANLLLKNQGGLTQPIPIYVSNEEEYKALMASNQPIIFDSGDPNKTLTVLTTPHPSTLENTTIDMNTSQTNDMMIIQDNYPLNVSEAVTSENSNIVVVYSHQVGDANKQYQLLTTQGLEAQFVQSSTILAQNFETITTTAPIMNANIIEKQVGDVWQNNIEQMVNTSHIEITPVASIHSIVTQNNEMQVTNLTESDTLLPEVQITANVTETTDSHTNVIVSQCQNIVEGSSDVNIEGECVTDTQTISVMETVEDGPIKHPVVVLEATQPTETNFKNVTEQSEHEAILSSDTVIDQTEIIHSQAYTQPEVESQTYTQPEQDVQLVTETIEEDNHHSKDMSFESQTTETEHNQMSYEEEPSGSELPDSVPETNNISNNSVNVENTLAKDVKETVETITSEWSEEDTQDKQTENLQETTSNGNPDAVSNEPQIDVEESIENIQHEVEKQLAKVPTEIQEDLHDVKDSSKESAQKHDHHHDSLVDITATQEKISSLLNDWEDNDSQEDNASLNENAPNESEKVVEQVSIETMKVSSVEKENPDKQDKIKSLVSDWDEDEEEARE